MLIIALEKSSSWIQEDEKNLPCLRLLGRALRCFPLMLFFSVVTCGIEGETVLAESGFAITPPVAQMIRGGQQALYNCDYPSAEREFDALIKLYPDHPAGYMYKAESIWWQCIRDRNNKELQSRFLRYSSEGIRRGEILVARDPKDFYAQMFLAGIYGNQTRFYVTVTHSYLAAMRCGLKGDKYNRNALALRPDCYDCRIGTGSYYYAPEALPPILRHMAMIIGVRGDKTRSIKDLEEVVQKGEFAQTEAEIVLLGIYYNEKWFNKYESLLRGLIRQYPSNYIFFMWLSNYWIEQHRSEEGIRFFSSLLEENRGFRRWQVAKDYAFLQKGRLEMDRGMVKEALTSFTQGMGILPNDKAFLAQAHLARGLAWDLLGQRAAAIQEYQMVLDLPNVEETQKHASRFLKNPFRGKL